MKIIVQKELDLHAFLMDDGNNVVVSEIGSTELEAVGRLVTAHPDKFNLTEVTGKHGPIELD